MWQRISAHICILLVSTTCIEASGGGKFSCQALIAELRYQAWRATITRDHGDNSWLWDGYYSENDARSVDSAFAGVLGADRTIGILVKKRNNLGLPVNIVELFGSGEFIRDFLPFIDSVTSVRLRAQYFFTSRLPFPNQYEPQPGQDPQGKRFEIEGNIFEKETWNQLDSYLSRKQIPNIDVIVIRPASGSSFLGNRPVEAMLGFLTLRRAYTRLSSNSGNLLFTVKTGQSLTPADLVSWVALLNSNGIQATLEQTPLVQREYADFAIRIIKTETSPRQLPALSNSL